MGLGRKYIEQKKQNAYKNCFPVKEVKQAYWQIGRIIVEHEQEGNLRSSYGKSVLQELSHRLTKEFGKGFSVRTLQQMKKFYVMFPNTNALRSQLTWTHYRLELPTAEELQHEIEMERKRIEEQEK